MLSLCSPNGELDELVSSVLGNHGGEISIMKWSVCGISL